MKKLYVKPALICEEFQATEYVAACGDSGKTYLFNCNAGGGELGDVYLEDGTNLTEGSWHYYYACGEEHEADSQDVFLEGKYVMNGGNDEQYYYSWGKKVYYESIPVMIWRGPDGNNVHCTTALDINSWETAKS